MVRIKKLSDEVIKKLLAFDFIKSPSSILQELIENSLDAKSSKIYIYLKSDFFSYLKVMDNGIGMSKNDIYLSCQRYTTSKISSILDLDNLNTYGFKGESLYSIRMLADLKISSKMKNQNESWSFYFKKNSNFYEISKDLPLNGTSVTVYNMDEFKNHFYYSNLGNFNDILFTFKKYVLSNFNVHFIFYNNNIEYLNFPPCFDDYSKSKRIENVFGDFFFKNFNNIYYKNDKFILNGFISFYKKKKKSNNFRLFFINDRFINDKSINLLIEDVFKSKNFKKNYYYCLYFYIDKKFFKFLLNFDKKSIVFLIPGVYSFIFNSLKNFLDENFKDIFKKKIIAFDNFNYNKDYFLLNKNLKKSEICYFDNQILTILDNTYLFFQMKNILYFSYLISLRKKIIEKKSLYQFSKYGKLLSKDLSFFKSVKFEKTKLFKNYKISFNLYGFDFYFTDDSSIILKSVPEILYNYYVKWDNLIIDIFNFFNKFIIKIGSSNRFENKILDLFSNNILFNSPCFNFEFNIFYKELSFFKINDYNWFCKNCYKVSYKKFKI